MKKLMTWLLLLALLSLTSISLAAGKATVTQEAFYITPYYNGTFSGVVYGEITNTGGRPVAIDSGIFEFFDADGEAIGSGTIYSFYPEIIKEGEHAYFRVSENIEKATRESDIDDYSITVVGKSTKDDEENIIEATPSYREYNDYKNTRKTELSVIIKNNTDEMVMSPKVVWAVYDTDGKLVYITDDSAYGVGLMPGSEIMLTSSINSDVQAIMNAAGVNIGEVVAIAWHK